MKRTGIAVASTVVILVGLGATPRAALSGEFRVNGRTFTLPEGFTIELVAGPPAVDRPIVADFDERGRLYVADSSGSNDDVKKQLAERPHRVVRLEDGDGDGVFDRRTVFADRMMFPAGAMWRDGSLYVSAPPSIWKLTDADGDGVADRRAEWFQGKTLTGCANDLHGPYPGPDGWVYWCKGAFARQTYERPGKAPFSTRAAHIFRARPDGTAIEPVMTGGMDNPVDVVFTPGGERIFTTTFLQNPGGGRRDGLIHAIYGGVYGKVNDAIDEHRKTGPDLMPVLAHLGPAAPAGLVRYESRAFGDGSRDSLFACQFNLRKVSRHRLIPDGATYRTVDEDFLIAADQDFHPTDVVEDADGSLLVVDTGGWYKLCCPTSQLEKPDILGAIYRVRKVGAPRVHDPRGVTIAWSGATVDALAARLGDARPAVRRRAVEALAARGPGAIPALRKVLTGGTGEARQDALWVAARIEGDEARSIARGCLLDADPTIALIALHSASLHRDREAAPILRELVRRPPSTTDLRTARAAAEALGRVGDRSAVPDLLGALARPADRVLEHSLIYALIEIDDPAATAAGLKSAHAMVRRGTMIALDQMDGGGVGPEVAAAGLSSGDPATREASAWVVGRHPEWGGVLAGVLGDRLRSTSLPVAERAELEAQLGRFAGSAAVQDLLATTIRDARSPPAIRVSALQAMGGSGLKGLPPAWAAGLAEALASADPGVVAGAVAAVRSLAVKPEGARGLVDGLLAIAGRPGLPVPLRLEALAAVPGGLATVTPEAFSLLRAALAAGNPVATRLLAAEVISRAKLSTGQLGELADLIATAGPLEIDRLLAAFEGTADASVGLRLVDAVMRSPALASLRVDSVRPRLATYPPEVRLRAEAIYAALNVDLAAQKARLDELATKLPAGEVRRGQAVFNGTKAACLTCHAVGYVGGKLGPDLSRVGQVRADRDLLESIVYPSASFVRSYEPMVVATRDGRTISGLVRKDSADEVVLATAADREERIPREEIDEIRPGTVSVMPAGLDAQLTPQELADLLAFLKSRK